jgi:hypothetical protein
MTSKKQLFFAFLVYSIVTSLAAELPRGAVTVRVVDHESQEVIRSAEVRIGFTVPNGQGGTTSRSVVGLTDAHGEFRAEEQTLPNIAAKAGKFGYYDSTIHHNLKLKRDQSYDPYNTRLTIALRQIGSPVAMYARKRARIEAPESGTPVAYDLIAADWLPPHGRGSIGDFVFVITRDDKPSLSKITVRFSNDGDGIQPVMAPAHEGSALRLPRLAPESDYQGELQLSAVLTPNQTVKTRNYFYRVRTEKRDGQIVRALYGKIHGEIDFDTINSKTAILLFTYYLNPDGSRNVEFDTNKNLFTTLPVMEQVREP